MSTIIRGRGVVRNAAGTVTIAGVAQINTAMNAEVHDASTVQQIKDAVGKVRTLVLPEVIKKVSVELIPGSDGTTATGGTIANAVSCGAMPTKMGTLILAGFPIDDYNGNYIILEDSPVKITADGNATVSVKGTQFETDFTALSNLTA